MRFEHHLGIIALLIGGLGGCGGTSEAPAADAGTPAPWDAGVVPADASEPPPVGETSPLTLILRSYDRPARPLEGAVVAIDVAGVRQEVVSDATGRAHFDAVDWSQGSIDLSVAAATGAVETYVGLRRADLGDEAEIEFGVYGAAGVPTATVTVTGALLGMADGDRFHFVEASVGEPHQARGADFELTVPADTPFDAIGCEFDASWDRRSGWPVLTQTFYGWTTRHNPGTNESMTWDLDLGAASLVPVQVSHRLHWPDLYGGGYLSRTALVYAMAFDAETEQRVGFATAVTPMDDGSVNVDLEYVQPDPTRPLRVRYYFGAFRSAPHSFAVTSFAGDPGQTPPPALSPPAAHEYIYRGSPIRWVPPTGPEGEEVGAGLMIMDGPAERIVQILYTAPGATELRIPPLPSNRSESEVYGAAGKAAFFAFDRDRTSVGTPFPFLP